MKRFLLNLWEIVEVILIALITVFFIRSFLVQPFLVSGASMEPTFNNGNYLLIDEVTYRFREPERGEVVVFRYPGDNTSFFIKRIIGLPKETIAINNNQIIVTNNSGTQVISEPYLGSGTKTAGQKTFSLNNNEYFVLGDNRTNSFDSRNWGPLSKDDIIGLVRLRIFPFNKFETVNPPAYSF